MINSTKLPNKENRDFSGLSIENVAVYSEDRSRSFFNGCNFSIVLLENSDFSHCEFSESIFNKVQFDNLNLSSSDFVGSTFSECVFLGCSFHSGEWRDAIFSNCEFTDCSFEHTTITLSEFTDCRFCKNSAKSIIQRSVYCNVFSSCCFGAEIINESFISRNYGAPNSSDSHSLVQSSIYGISVEQLCLLNSTGNATAIDYIGAARAIGQQLISSTLLKPSVLQFFTLITRSAANRGKLSAPALVLMEEAITNVAGQIDDPRVYNLSLSFALEVRVALRKIWQSSQRFFGGEYVSAKTVEFYFAETYSIEEVSEFVETISMLVFNKKDQFKILSFENGSTRFKIIVATVALLSANQYLDLINKLVRNMDAVVISTTALVDSVSKLNEKLQKLSQSTKKTDDTLPMLEKNNISIDQIAPPVSELFSLVSEPDSLMGIRNLPKSKKELMAKFDTKVKVLVSTQA